VPGWVIIGGGLRQVAEKTEPVRSFAVVDETGRYGAAIGVALAERQARAGLEAFCAWARAHNVHLGAPARPARGAAALLAEDGDGPAAVARLATPGGATGLLAMRARQSRPALNFVPPPSHLRLVEAPPELAAAARSGDEAALEPYLSGARPIAGAKLFALAVIPKDFSPDAPRFDY